MNSNLNEPVQLYNRFYHEQWQADEYELNIFPKNQLDSGARFVGGFGMRVSSTQHLDQLGHEGVAVLLPSFTVNRWQNQVTRQPHLRGLTHLHQASYSY